MNLIVWRGTKQIGGSCLEVSSATTRIIIDIGEVLPEIAVVKQRPRALPDAPGLFGRGDRKIDAILVSHGHGDHLGLIDLVDTEIPVFIGEKALKIYNLTAQFTGRKPIANPIKYLQSGQGFKVGDFTIVPYLVDHSGFDAYAFLLEQGGKTLVYTGDFRFHGRKQKATEYFVNSLPDVIDVLLIEGTMLSRTQEKVETEEEIERKAYEFMSSQSRPVLVLQSATNIDRLVGMYRAAKKSGRIFVMDIFTAHIVSQLNPTIPKPGRFGDIRVFYPYNLTNRMFREPEGQRLMKQFSRHKILKEELGTRKDYCMLIRDSMLSDLRYIKNLQGAGLIYSLWSGYKQQDRMSKVLTFAEKLKMEIVDLHTSGHAYLESIAKVINITKPKMIVPIHTERPHFFAEQFEQVYLAEDGEEIRIS